MFFEMVCQCNATLQIDVEKNREEAAWLLVSRFSNAHVACGFITPLYEEMPQETKRFNIKATPDQDTQ
jgi:hypothetical protein